MKIKKMLFVVPLVLGMTLCLTGCQKDEKKPEETITSEVSSESATKEMSEQTEKILGSWAYIHDKGEEILAFKEDGTAVYKGSNYTFNCDDTFVYLKDEKNPENNINMRYIIDKDGIFFYESTVYTYQGEGTPNSVVGLWKSGNWTYEFSASNTFMEDKIFTGNYSVNESEASIKLMYGAEMEDTTLYYTLEGKDLTIEYPWKMVVTTAE